MGTVISGNTDGRIGTAQSTNTGVEREPDKRRSYRIGPAMVTPGGGMNSRPLRLYGKRVLDALAETAEEGRASYLAGIVITGMWCS